MFMGCLRDAYGMSKRCLCDVYEMFMGCLRDVYGMFMRCLWDV